MNFKNLFEKISVISLITAIICISSDIKNNYFLIFLIPSLFSICNIIFTNVLEKLFKTFVFKIIYFQMCLRYILIPLFIALGSNFEGGYSSYNVDAAVFITCIELIFVFIAFLIISRKHNHKYRKRKIEFLNKYTISFLLILFGIVYILSKEIFLMKINYFWNMGDYYLDYSVREMTEEIDNIDYLIFFRLRLLIVILGISLLYNFKRIGRKWKWIISFLLVLLNATIIQGSSRFSIIYITVPFLIILLELYPEFKKKMLTMGGLSFVIIFLISSLIKFSSATREANMDDVFNIDMFNAYFSGIGNVALGVDSYIEHYDGNNLKYLASDLFQNIPKLSHEIDQNYRTTKIFNYQYYNSDIGKSQIVPVQISGLFHFGYFLSFTYSFIFVFLAFYFEKLAKRAQFIGSKYIFLYLCLNCSLFMMLNLGSLISNIFNHLLLTLLPLLFLQRGFLIFNKKL